jgi:TIR domain/prokaryotic YEATS domain
MPVKIFFCYAHEDEALLNKLKTHLRPLQRQGLIDIWYDRDINAGTEWEREIKEQLNSAQIILLLVSPDFMNSDYCYSIEMKRALERDKRGEAKVIPIILRPVDWQGVLGRLQALPTDAKPVTSSSWYSLDDAFFDIAEGIKKLAEKLMIRPPVSMDTRNFIFDNYSLYIGERGQTRSGTVGRFHYYKWKVFMDEPADKLALVKSVEYRLHSSFTNPIRMVENRDTRFALQSEGWGEFIINITIYLNDGTVEHSKYPLDLHKPRGDLPSTKSPPDPNRYF